MKTSIYDRIPSTATEDLLRLRSVWAMRIEMRKTAPRRHDYIGKCFIRATLVLEERGALPCPKVILYESDRSN